MEKGTITEFEIKVEVDAIINDHLRNSTSVLQDIFDEGEKSTSPSDGHTCPHCGKIYKTLSTLYGHCLLKHPSNQEAARCDSCDKNYSSLLSYQKHVHYMHRYDYKCKTCYKGFASVDLLNDHTGSCRKEESPCPSCGKVYDSELALRNHLKYKHPEEKQHSCDLCFRTFSTFRRLVNHKAAVHPLGATSCTQCDKNFTSVRALQSHMLYKHTEDGAKCVHCYKVFAKKISLKRHLAKNHLLIKDMGRRQLNSDEK